MPTLNERAHELCNAMVTDAEKLGIAVSKLNCGTRIVDCGVKAPGSIAAGLRLAEICMSGLGRAEMCLAEPEAWQGPGVRADIHDEPIVACMASQYAGWEIKGENFFAMGSGPMRAAACREELFKEIGRCEKPDVCVGVLETGKLPPDTVCVEIAQKCGIAPNRLTLLVARTSSIAGTLQIVARSVETALHKLHVLKFDINCIEAGWGIAPLPPLADDDLAAIGHTNDAILYGTSVGLRVMAEDDLLKEIGPKVPSCASSDYGRPFAEIFQHYGGDFYKIDPMLFSPAQITFFNRQSGHYLKFGQFAPAVLAESFAKK
jgi:methenyltetrahydromethanopterin cyclohydrolase